MQQPNAQPHLDGKGLIRWPGHKGPVYMVEVIRDGKRGPEVVQRSFGKNLVVNTGKRQIWRIAAGVSTTVFDQMRIGTSGIAATSGSTNVVSPVTGTLNTADSLTLLAATRTFQWLISYPSGGGSKSATDIQEVAVLNQNTSPGGSALNRSVFTPSVNKTTNDKLRITYQARVT